MDGVAAADVGCGIIDPDFLKGTSNGGGGDIGGAEVVHVGGVRPEGVDRRARSPHALVGGGHAVVHGGVGIGEEALVRTVDCRVNTLVLKMGGTVPEAVGVARGGVEIHAARVGADAGAELLEVVEVVEHGSEADTRKRTESNRKSSQDETACSDIQVKLLAKAYTMVEKGFGCSKVRSQVCATLVQGGCGVVNDAQRSASFLAPSVLHAYSHYLIFIGNSA